MFLQFLSKPSSRIDELPVRRLAILLAVSFIYHAKHGYKLELTST